MADNDLMVLQDAEAALSTLSQKYRLAVLNKDFTTIGELKPELDKAADAYQAARQKLLAEGVIMTEADVMEMRRIKAEIDQAADTQSMVQGALKLAGFIAKVVAL